MTSIFDAHFHIIDPSYPLVKNRGFFPEPFLFEDYMKQAELVNITAGAIVSGSYHGYDQTYLKDALRRLGTEFVGVTQVPFHVTDDEIVELNKAGVRAVRLNVYNGLTGDFHQIEKLAKRIYEIAKWHIEFHIQSSKLEEYMPIIEKLPAVSIDHLGLERNGYETLLKLVDKGVKVKASGFGRVDFDVSEALKTITSINPDSLMFGSDLPSTRVKRPFREQDIELIKQTFSEKESRKILYENAKEWYLK